MVIRVSVQFSVFGTNGIRNGYKFSHSRTALQLLTIVKLESLKFVNLNKVRVATDLPNPNQEEINFWEKVIQNGKEVRKEVQWIKKESLLFGKPTVEGSFYEIFKK